MIIFSSTPDSILKAYLLSKLTKDGVLAERNSDSLLFSGLSIIDSDTYVLDELEKQFFDCYHRSTTWLHTYKGNNMQDTLYYALRHISADKFKIIFKALDDAFFKGIQHFLNGATPSCKKLLSLESEVHHDVYRMMGFLRFKKAGENCLVAEPKLFHDTLDLLLIAIQDRYPYHRIVLIDKERCLGIENRKLFEPDREFYEKALSMDEYEKAWEDYYKSQYIPAYRNIKLAASHIPRKYWDWLPEGAILREESKK